MIVDLLVFAGSIALLWFSSDLVTREIGPIARRLGVSELVVTVLGVSVLSSLPELTVSGFAIAQGNAELSIGNVIGSNFVTLTFVTALCAFIRPIPIETQIRERESSWMILASSLVLMLSLDGRLGRLDGLILIAAYVPYIITVLRAAEREAEGLAEDHQEGRDRGRMWVKVLLSLAAIGGIILGAKFAVDAGQNIGLALGIPPIALGVILFAFGTSLPELSIALAATFKKKASVTIGEVYASNIFTQLVVLGVCAMISPIAISESMLTFAMPFLILAAVLIQIFITTGKKLNRAEAAILMLLYAFFAVSSFFKLPQLETLIPW